MKTKAKVDKKQELLKVKIKAKDIENIDESALLKKLNEEETVDLAEDEVDAVSLDALFGRLNINTLNRRMEDVKNNKHSGHSEHYQKNSKKQPKGLINEDYLESLLEKIVDRAIDKHIDRIITGVGNMIQLMASTSNDDDDSSSELLDKL